jgi:uncharacterized protein YbjT (DUF2867 family)
LLRRLQTEKVPLRCLLRNPEALRDVAGPATELVHGDVLAPDTLPAALEGIDTAYYLVHSMGARGDFAADDRRAAENFARAAKDASVARVIYLGGLARPDGALSDHLRSRLETGDVLRAHHGEVLELRSGIIIGSGSLSFELIRTLVERLPIMICPRWVRVETQPIAIEDVLSYLIEALRVPLSGSETFEIGGPDVVSYGDIMREYARARDLRRIMVPVPLLSPHLSSLWLGLVTPLYARVGRRLIDSMKHPTILRNQRASVVFTVRPRGVKAAIARALQNEDRECAETFWHDALASASSCPLRYGGVRVGSRLVDSRAVSLPVSAEQAFVPLRRIGGKTGWYFANWLWSLRGFIDLLAGGVGMRRGRRDPDRLRVGDALDCWRVEAFAPPCRLRLRAEMRLPGRAWLEFEITPSESGCVLRQTASFDAHGLRGLLYWYAIYPLHHIVFSGMLKRIARAACRPDLEMLAKPTNRFEISK